MTEIYSTDTDSGTLSVFEDMNGTVRKIATIRVGNAPRGSVRFTSDGRGFVSNTSANTVSEIDGLAHKEVRKIKVGNGPRGLFIVGNEKYLLVSNSGSDSLSIVDLNIGEEVRQLPIGRDPRHMAVVNNFAYVSLWGEGSIAKFDISSLDDGDVNGVALVSTIKLAPETFPYSLNIDESRKIALVACNSVRSIPVIDLEADTVCGHIPVRASGIRAITFSNDNKYAVATLERDNSAAVIDLDTFEVTRYLDAGPAPRGIVTDPDNGAIYIAAFSRSTTARYDMPDWGSHGVTIIKADSDALSDKDSAIETATVKSGFGPCSVSLFDPASAMIARKNLDKQLRYRSF
ncbi:YncE family protein [Arcanobacterium buesumense]|uniref:YncE family protein n=1 Tax=Arcanobacterium buesumense TaxID=2722751 RepID=A0A6H2ELJ6_9ACTO|nr:YncE family protein [Arcanobacterium buesumense]QJC21945.1 YncE family protein [Arcanobacterium buesumense]